MRQAVHIRRKGIGRRGALGIALATLLAAVLAALWHSSGPSSAERLLERGLGAFEEQRFEEALEYLEQIPDDGSATAAEARCWTGNLLLLEMNRLSAAEQQFRRAVQQDADHLMANDHLAYVLGLSSRNWEQIPYRLALIRLNRPQLLHLYLLALGDTVLENPERIQQFHDAHPRDPAARLGLARIAREEQRPGQAEQLLRELVEDHPQLIEAQVQLGRVLLETGTSEELQLWHARLPAAADAHPGIWALRGGLARQHDQPTVAARCYWEAVRRDPNHSQANYQLGQMLIGLGQSDQADTFLDRARRLEAYINTVKVARVDEGLEEMSKAAQQAEGLGLLWEAYGWTCLVLERQPGLSGAQATFLRLQPQLAGLPPSRTAQAANPARDVDLSAWPLPGRDPPAVPAAAVPAASAPADTITFQDQAAAAGLDFRYFNGGQPDQGISRMYEFTGGGVAVLDYDGDGWPDIYLTQGCPWPPSEDSQYLDRLYRNNGRGGFDEVTLPAGLRQHGFSQGVTVGDFNNDGFPDLYVANIGRNRLYRNNGDGTFSDVSHRLPGDQQRWTTSCLIADVNGDGLPDIYAVNYLSGQDVFTRVCRDSRQAGQCMPQHFPASQDQLYLNLGDGRFEEVTAESGIELPDGKGLGIVAGDLDGSGKISLFIANDAVPNFYLANQTTSPGDRPRFAEQGLAVGLAFNDQGRQEACMGVAAGDADANGLLDLFVTNFAQESNTLYLQQPGRLFLDATRQSGLHGPSLRWLGFGTQFLDAQLDGWLDLVVSNGHIDDLGNPEIGYQMPPQFFHNRAAGTFVEIPAADLGPYFQGNYLGRGMARLDWNRDGREDLVISHLDAPAALLTNTTNTAGNVLAVQLRGVRSDRDAIGATVTVQVDQRTLVRQLTAGDGYQASNQRQLVFGLGASTSVEHLTVRWPSGHQQRFSHPPANAELLLIEGHPSPIRQRSLGNIRSGSANE